MVFELFQYALFMKIWKQNTNYRFMYISICGILSDDVSNSMNNSIDHTPLCSHS